MSCIYGIRNFNNTPLDPTIPTAMQQVLNHWQADNTNTIIQDNLAFGHLMLYNTPESLAEVLPLYNDDKDLLITADARLDNCEELYALLNITDHTVPDSTLILLLYLKYGVNSVNHLVGDFAIAIFDKKAGKLFCIRDQMGVKPLFYYHDNHFFAFASEKKGLLAIPGLNADIDRQFLYNQMIHVGGQSPDTTLYQHIRRVPPAHYLELNIGTKEITLHRYWDLDALTEIHFDTEQEYYDAFLQHFKEAVKCRLRSAYPIAAELSGGMDSSGITGVASALLKQAGKELITISNTIPHHVTDREVVDASEQRYIDEVVNFNGITNAIITESKPVTDPFDEPDLMIKVDDGLEFWQQRWQTPIRKAARKEGVRTLLSGFPGDEMVTYRGKYYMLDHLDKGHYFKYFFAKKNFMGFNKTEPFLSYKLRYNLHLLKEKLGFYNTHIKAAIQTFNIPAEAIKVSGDVNWKDRLKVDQYKDYRHYQKHRALRNHVPARLESETRYGYYYRLEPRFPMADIRLMQFYLSMPNYLKYKGDLNRNAYRQALKDYLPKLLLDRPDKQGDMVPFVTPIKEDLVRKKLADSFKAKTDAQTANLAGHPLLKHPINKNGKNRVILRWLEQNKHLKF